MFDWAGVSYSKVSIVEIRTSWARWQELWCFPTEIICFGCGLKHPWSQRQDNGTYVVTCPNKAKPGVKAAAAVKIADMRAKRKARQQGQKDKKKHCA